MRKALHAMLFVVTLSIFLASSALAAESKFLPGWESWNAIDFGSHVSMTCPEKNATVEQVLSSVSKLIAENQGVIGKEYKQFQMRFVMTRSAFSYSEAINFMTQEIMPIVCGVWPCPETYAVVTASAGKTNTEYIIYLAIDVNGTSQSDDMTVLYQTIKQAADYAISMTKTPREQLRYVQQWLGAHVTYRNTGTPYESTAYGAIVQGEAVCGGYTEAVSIFCRYLGIPCVTVRNASHIWNAVWIEVQWLHWDATWADGVQMAKYFLIQSISNTDGSHEFSQESLCNTQQRALALQKYYNTPSAFYRTALDLDARSILCGTGDGLSLSSALTRAQFAVLLMRMHGTSTMPSQDSRSFSDAPAWAASGISWCVSQGVLRSVSANFFGSDQNVALLDFEANLPPPMRSPGDTLLRADFVYALSSAA